MWVAQLSLTLTLTLTLPLWCARLWLVRGVPALCGYGWLGSASLGFEPCAAYDDHSAAEGRQSALSATRCSRAIPIAVRGRWQAGSLGAAWSVCAVSLSSTVGNFRS